MGGVRAGLVLVDERVVVLTGRTSSDAHDAVGACGNGGAGQDHEIRRATRHIKRIVRLKRNSPCRWHPVDEIQSRSKNWPNSVTTS
jgi:hypothetical protein